MKQLLGSLLIAVVAGLILLAIEYSWFNPPQPSPGFKIIPSPETAKPLSQDMPPQEAEGGPEVPDKLQTLRDTAMPIKARDLRDTEVQPGKVSRVGVLTGGTPHSVDERPKLPFWQALREMGWIEGQNLVVEWRGANGRYERLPDLAAELVRLPLDVIVIPASAHAAFNAKKATRVIPIVFYGISDPVEIGLVKSLAQPGGNITGVSIQSIWELAPKRLQLLKEAVPQVSRVAVFWNPDQLTHRDTLREVTKAARALELELLTQAVSNSTEVEQAFHAVIRNQANGMLLLGDSMLATQRSRIVQWAIKNRLPSIHIDRVWVQAGGLMSYGASRTDLQRRAATLVDKILRGAKPAELPVEQPTKFELVLNRETAQALGIEFPPTLLVLADEAHP